MRKSKFSETPDRRDPEGRGGRRPGARTCCGSTASARPRSSSGGASTAGASVSDVKRLRELEAENAKLKRMYADLALENAAIKDVLQPKAVTPSAKRQIAEVLVREHQLPVQRACRVVRLSRTAYYQPPMPASRRDAAVIAALTDAVARYPRWGFWKLFDRLRAGGPAVESQARASRVLRAAAESAATHDAAGAAADPPAAGGAAGAESDLGARLHDARRSTTAGGSGC